MHKTHIYTFLIVTFSLLSTPGVSQNAKQNAKQLNKAIRRNWGISESTISLLDSNIIKSYNYHLNGKIFIIKEKNNHLGFAYVGRVFSCRSGGCAAEFKIQTEEDYEYFDYLILLDKNICVDIIRVFSYQATHGQEVCRPSWLKQFHAYDGATELDYGKEIDAISGATISAISLIIDVQSVVKQISEIINDKALNNS